MLYPHLSRLMTLAAVCLVGTTLLAAPTAAQDLTPEQVVSLESVNKPGMYVAHADGLARLTSDLSEGRQEATFTIREGLTGEAGTISFESVDQPGHFLRHQGYRIKLHQPNGSDLFRRDATFKPVDGLASGGRSFESVNFPGRYLRHCSYELYIDNNQMNNAACNPADAVYRQDATFEVAPGLAQ